MGPPNFAENPTSRLTLHVKHKIKPRSPLPRSPRALTRLAARMRALTRLAARVCAGALGTAAWPRQPASHAPPECRAVRVRNFFTVVE